MPGISPSKDAEMPRLNVRKNRSRQGRGTLSTLLQSILPELVALSGIDEPHAFCFALRESLKKFVRFKNFGAVFCDEKRIHSQISDFSVELQREYETRFFPDRDPLWLSYQRQRLEPGRLADVRIAHWSELKKNDPGLVGPHPIQRFYRRSRDSHVLAQVIHAPDGGLLGYVGLSRSSHFLDFSPSERVLFIAYHSIIRKKWIYFHQGGRETSPMALFSSFQMGFIFYDAREKKILFQNSIATPFLEIDSLREFLAATPGAPLASVSSDRAVLASGYLEYFLPTSREKMIHLRATPVFQGKNDLFCIILSWVDFDRIFTAVTDRFGKSNDLSRGEKKLLDLLMNLTSNQELADRLGVKKSTLVSRLKGLFVKTGMKNKADLLSTLAAGGKKPSE